MGTALGEATEPATRVPGLCTQAPTGRGSAQSGWPSGCLWPGDGPGLCPEGDRVRLGTQDGHWVSGSPLKSGSGLVVREGSPRALEQNHQNGVLSVPQQAGPGAGLSLITETPGPLWGQGSTQVPPVPSFATDPRGCRPHGAFGRPLVVHVWAPGGRAGAPGRSMAWPRPRRRLGPHCLPRTRTLKQPDSTHDAGLSPARASGWGACAEGPRQGPRQP